MPLLNQQRSKLHLKPLSKKLLHQCRNLLRMFKNLQFHKKSQLLQFHENLLQNQLLFHLRYLKISLKRCLQRKKLPKTNQKTQLWMKMENTSKLQKKQSLKLKLCKTCWTRESLMSTRKQKKETWHWLKKKPYTRMSQLNKRKMMVISKPLRRSKLK